MVFVNSETSDLYDVISGGPTRFKYRTTDVHISSSDSIICLGQGQPTLSAFYLKVHRKGEGIPTCKIIDFPIRRNNKPAQSWDLIISMSHIIKFKLQPILIHQAKIMKTWSLANRIKTMLLYFQLGQSNICVIQKPSLVLEDAN